jgi:hypothetical protein
LFDIWAPGESVWSPWAKPVLFTDIPLGMLGLPGNEAPPVPELPWKLAPGCAVVVDAPGAQSVLIGMALARRGLRPVPLYNTTGELVPLVPCTELMSALCHSAPELERLAIAPDAPPAFLIDSTRMSGRRRPGVFDNRWMVFEQDFPSAAFLRSKGIRSVALAQDEPRMPGPDLWRVLGAWKKGDLEITRPRANSGELEPLSVRAATPSRVAALFAMIFAGLWYNSTGGFGSRVPTPSSGGGGFA